MLITCSDGSLGGERNSKSEKESRKRMNAGGGGREEEECHSRDLKHSSRGRCMPLFGLSKFIFLGFNEVVPAAAWWRGAY